MMISNEGFYRRAVATEAGKASLRGERQKPLRRGASVGVRSPLAADVGSARVGRYRTPLAAPFAALRSNPPNIIMAAKRPDVRRQAAGRRRSSEDDLLLRLNHVQDRGVGRGLNPAPDERGPATI
jgi:hypothetical protein